MFRLGIISEIGEGENLGYARVSFDENEIVSGWLAIPSMATYKTKHWIPVEVNAQVLCSMDENCEQGAIVLVLWSDTDTPPDCKYKLIALGAVIMIPLNVLVLKAVSNLPQKDFNIVQGDFGDIKPVGIELYNHWIVAFELISILLLIALVGSVVLAKKRKSKIISKED